MRIGILGSGNVGQALARGYLDHGHEVRMGTRQTDDAGLAFANPAPAAEVAAWAELAVLAVNGSVAASMAAELAEPLGAKVVVDTTNPLDFSSGVPALSLGFDDSLGEQVQRAVPNARVVKAYNIIGNPYMVDPSLPGGVPVMLVAGDDAEAKRDVAALLRETGWSDVVDLGGIDASRLLEPLAVTWVRLGIATGSWNIAFSLLRG